MNSTTLKEIQINNLSVTASLRSCPILNDITLTLKSHNFYALIGPNGAGKSTLVKEILGLSAKNFKRKGSILFDSKESCKLSRKETASLISYLPQNVNYDLDFSVREMVEMGREPYRKFMEPLSAFDNEKIDEAIEFTGIQNLVRQPFKYLSGGEKQKVIIARIIAQDTPWIILDEPVANIDINHEGLLMRVFKKLVNEKNKTVISIIHDINVAAAFSSHMIFLKNGKVIEAGKSEEILNNDSLNKLYDTPFTGICIDNSRLYFAKNLLSES